MVEKAFRQDAHRIWDWNRLIVGMIARSRCIAKVWCDVLWDHCCCDELSSILSEFFSYLLVDRQKVLQIFI